MNDNEFDALADRQRRVLLLGLLGRNRQHVSQLSGTSRELIEANAELLDKHLSSTRNIPDVDEELLRTHVVHLPKLVEYGYVEWDRDDDVVTRGPRFDDVQRLLALLYGSRADRAADVPVIVDSR